MTPVDPPLDLLSVGSWAIFDHLARIAAYPEDGSTIQITSGMRYLDTPFFGDCSANLAAVAAALGTRVGLAMVVGDDFVASGYEAHLKAVGVDLRAVDVRPGERSGHNYLYSDGEGRGFCLSHLGIAADQEEWRVPDAALEAAQAVVVNEKFGPYTLDALKRAKERGRLTAINGMVGTAGTSTTAFLEATDVLFIAASECRNLQRVLGSDGPDDLLRFGPKLVFVTHGSRGSEVWSSKGRTYIPVVPASRVVDATGAGDAYAAGTLSALLRGFSPEEAAAIGAATASFIVEEWGAQTRLPTWAEAETRSRKQATT